MIGKCQLLIANNIGATIDLLATTIKLLLL